MLSEAETVLPNHGVVVDRDEEVNVDDNLALLLACPEGVGLLEAIDYGLMLNHVVVIQCGVGIAYPEVGA